MKRSKIGDFQGPTVNLPEGNYVFLLDLMTLSPPDPGVAGWPRMQRRRMLLTGVCLKNGA